MLQNYNKKIKLNYRFMKVFNVLHKVLLNYYLLMLYEKCNRI